MQLHFIIYFILLAREDLQQQEPSNTVLSYLFAQPARMEGTLKNYINNLFIGLVYCRPCDDSLNGLTLPPRHPIFFKVFSPHF